MVKVLGSLSGPVFGSLLYWAGGYVFPFIVLGGFLFAMSFFISSLFKIEDENEKEQKLEYFSHLKNKVIKILIKSKPYKNEFFKVGLYCNIFHRLILIIFNKMKIFLKYF